VDPVWTIVGLLRYPFPKDDKTKYDNFSKIHVDNFQGRHFIRNKNTLRECQQRRKGVGVGVGGWSIGGGIRGERGGGGAYM
jgi:hypothetical protein